MKRWLLCLFSYNRVELLRNAVASIDAFFPFGDRLIVDDGSDQAGMAEFLADIGRKSGWQVEVRSREAGRDYGGYYRNMRYALERALESGYDYCFFFEDDEQFVWKKEDYPAYVDNLFAACPDAIQIQPLFLRRIHTYADTIEYVRPAGAYRTNRGFSTSAIWNLAAVRQHPDYRFFCTYGDDLPSNSAYWLKKGYRLYFQGDPTVAVMPWVASRSLGDSRDTGGARGPEQKFQLRPLDAGEIEYLRTRPPSVPPYQEYFRLSDANIARPIWHQKGLNLGRYRYLCRAVVDQERAAGASPAPVRVLERWQPTTIPPLASHLAWEGLAKKRAEQQVHRRNWPAWTTRPRRFLRSLRDFSAADWLGYRELSRRLKKEQRALPHWPATGRE
jgi:hypothetical protein